MEALQRIARDMMDRIVGPLHFRLLLQPAVAIYLESAMDGRMRGTMLHLTSGQSSQIGPMLPLP